MNWVDHAKALFKAPKPRHFTNYRHCAECADHDRVLSDADVDSIGLRELGNPAWDPMCFASPEGKKYYLPAMVRLSLDSMDDEFYLEQFLFHLESDGFGNDFYLSCTPGQRRFIAGFLEHLIETFTDQIEAQGCTDQALRSHAIWSRP